MAEIEINQTRLCFFCPHSSVFAHVAAIALSSNPYLAEVEPGMLFTVAHPTLDVFMFEDAHLLS